MKQRYLMFLISTALLLGIGSETNALYMESQITPRRLSQSARTFRVKSRTENGLHVYDITVRPDAGKPLSLARWAWVDMTDQKHITVASMPIQEHQQNGILTYTFAIASKSIGWSRFTFKESGYVLMKDSTRQNRVIADAGGFGEWFYLRDFVSP